MKRIFLILPSILAVSVLAAEPLIGPASAPNAAESPVWEPAARALRSQRDTLAQQLLDAQLQVAIDEKQIQGLSAKVAELEKKLAPPPKAPAPAPAAPKSK